MPKHTSPFITRKKRIFSMNQLRKEKKMNINLPKYNQTVYAELLQAMVWNNKCALCAATGTGKSLHCRKICPGGSNRAGYTHSGPIPMNSWITNRSMHTWTEEEISILKANADLTSEEIRSRFFPGSDHKQYQFCQT